MRDEIDTPAYHYGVIARAIARIDAAGGTKLPLEALAGDLNMSPAHFQRVFSRWVGVSPKRYQQYLTLDHAKLLLAEHFTVLETADATGLSGGGRLHDLFLRWEAMSPGDYAKAGEGLVLRWGWFDTPFGEALAMATDRGLAGLAFAGDVGREAAMADLRGRWPKAEFVEDRDAV
ncbi:MAG: helix-turn-helix domain-containing protein, partial [Paracoccaceae bacterium]|nr:helix-turn-helix domain-containing protein [Paracoccaceae bacterium]